MNNHINRTYPHLSGLSGVNDCNKMLDIKPIKQNKMKITVKVTKETVEQLEITAPYYCKLENTYLALLDENENYIKIFDCAGRLTVERDNSLGIYSTMIPKAEVITREEFENKLNEAIRRVRL